MDGVVREGREIHMDEPQLSWTNTYCILVNAVLLGLYGSAQQATHVFI